METQSAQVTKEVQGTTGFSFVAPRPSWAVWMFRTEFILNKAVLLILGGSSLVNPAHVKEAVLWVGAVDFIVWGFSHSLGVTKKEIEDDTTIS